MTKLSPSNELLGASVSNILSATDLRAFKSDPHSFILSRANVDISGDVNFSFADNSDSVVHLALPYYSSLEEKNVTGLTAQELASVSGGEIVADTGDVPPSAQLLAAAAIDIAAAALERANHYENSFKKIPEAK